MTNVAIVKLKKGGKKFEIATYPNKVMAWRQGIEKDLDEVLQSEQVYMNVSRGEIAKSKDLKKCFGSDALSAVIDEILSKGQIQESEKERARAQDNMFKEIATIVLEKCVHSETRRPLTFGYVERIMKELHFAIKPEDSAKKQALKLIQVLQESEYPVSRAPMQVQVRVGNSEEVVGAIKDLVLSVEKDTSVADSRVLVCNVDPGSYRNLDKVVKKDFNGDIEVLQLAVRLDDVESLVDKVDAASLEASRRAAAGAQEGGKKGGGKMSAESDGFTTATAPGVVFATRDAMREHMKSDWHKFNLKRKTQKLEMLNREEYQEAASEAAVDGAFFS